MHPLKISFGRQPVVTITCFVTLFAIIFVGRGEDAALSQTAPDLPVITFKFAVTDDSRAQGIQAIQKNGVATVVLTAIAKDIVSQGVDFVLFPGDMVLGETDATSLDAMLTTWEKTMSPLANANIPVYVTRGNHEYFSKDAHTAAFNPGDPGKKTYLSHFQMPPNGPEGEIGLTYSFTWKNAKIIAFDQYVGRREGFNSRLYSQGSNKGQMMNPWVLAQINNSPAGVNFVMAHEQIFPTGSHQDCFANDPDSRDALVHALATHNGTYFSGHDHLYIRGVVTNSNGDRVPAFTVGTAGAGNYNYGTFDVAAAGYQGPDQYTVQNFLADNANPIFGYLLITVYSDNTWRGEFRGFRFNHWGDPTDVSTTPFEDMDHMFMSHSVLH